MVLAKPVAQADVATHAPAQFPAAAVLRVHPVVPAVAAQPNVLAVLVLLMFPAPALIVVVVLIL